MWYCQVKIDLVKEEFIADFFRLSHHEIFGNPSGQYLIIKVRSNNFFDEIAEKMFGGVYRVYQTTKVTLASFPSNFMTSSICFLVVFPPRNNFPTFVINSK